MIQAEHINEIAILNYVSITVWCVGGFSSSSFTLVLYIIFNQAYNLITFAHLCHLYSKRRYAEIKLSYNVLRTLITILHILMQQTIYHETKHNYACHTVEMNNFSFIYTIIQQLCSNPTQCLVTIQKEKQTNHQSNSHTMLNYLLLQMSKTLSNIVIRNENLQTISQVTAVVRLVLLLSSLGSQSLLRNLDYYLDILKLQDSGLWFLVHITH